MAHPYKAVLEQAHAAADAYLANSAERRVFPSEDAVANLTVFDEALPAEGLPEAETLALLADKGAPATVGAMGGRYFGFVVGGAVPVSVGANMIAGAWDQCPSSHINSPIGVKLEAVAARWLLELLDLPAESAVGLTTGATMANFSALAAARHALLARAGWNVEEDGLYGAPEVKVIVSAEVHVTVEKALSMLGFGKARVTRVPVDSNGAMIAAELPPLDALTIVCTQAGNVNSGAIDPIGEIADLAEAAGAWVHVDGAFGLWGRMIPAVAPMLEGLERAHSFATDAHKWLNTPYDCGIVICRDASAQHAAMATNAPYLQEGTNAPKDMVPEFSRRARGIEVWAALRTLGRDGLAEMFARCCTHAGAFAEGLRGMGFTVLNDVVLNQVVATIGTADELTAIQQHVEHSGECWFGPTVWRGTHAVRISVSSWRTTAEDVERSLAAIEAAKNAVME
jgi:glutamate/tyrosine decarboxylase-like PLP-dependent enzyme